MSERDIQRRGNGCLYLMLGVGVLLVVTGLAWEKLPDLAGSDDAAVPVQRGFAPQAAEAPEAAEPAPPPPAPAPPPEPEPAVEGDYVMWHARSLPVGDEPPRACVVTARLSRRLDGPTADHVWVDCGEERLFDGEIRSHDISELDLGERGLAYRLGGSAMGEDGSLFSFVTGEHHGIVSGARTTSLDVADPSIPRQGEPFFTSTRSGAARDFHPLRRRALVRGLDGPVPPVLEAARRGDVACRLAVHPSMDPSFSCRVTLRCGSEILYGRGTTGYNQCAFEAGRVASADDTGMTTEDSDPKMSLSVADGRVVLSDASLDGTWEATLRLGELEGCGALVSRDGRMLDGRNHPFTLSHEVEDQWRISMVGHEPAVPEVLVGDCLRGELALDAGFGELAVTYGIDGESLAGYWRWPDDEPQPVLVSGP